MFNVAFLCLRDRDIPEPLCAEEVIGPAIFQHANTFFFFFFLSQFYCGAGLCPKVHITCNSKV